MAATPLSEAQTLRTIELIVSDALPPGWSLSARPKPVSYTHLTLPTIYSV